MVTAFTAVMVIARRIDLDICSDLCTVTVTVHRSEQTSKSSRRPSWSAGTSGAARQTGISTRNTARNCRAQNSAGPVKGYEQGLRTGSQHPSRAGFAGPAGTSPDGRGDGSSRRRRRTWQGARPATGRVPGCVKRHVPDHVPDHVPVTFRTRGRTRSSPRRSGRRPS